MCLNDEAVRGLLSDAAACTPAGSRIVFTHKIPDGRKVLPMMLRLTGEPIRSEVRSEDLPDYIADTGWAMISGVDINPAHGIERYGIAERL